MSAAADAANVSPADRAGDSGLNGELNVPEDRDRLSVGQLRVGYICFVRLCSVLVIKYSLFWLFCWGFFTREATVTGGREGGRRGRGRYVPCLLTVVAPMAFRQA